MASKPYSLLLKVGIFVAVFSFAFIFSSPVYAAPLTEGLVPCEGVIGTIGNLGLGCTICDLLKLAQNVINKLMILATLLATLLILYSAFLMMTSGGDPGKMGEGKKIILGTIIALVIIFGAWFIVDVIFKLIANKELGPWNKIDCAVTQPTSDLEKFPTVIGDTRTPEQRAEAEAAYAKALQQAENALQTRSLESYRAGVNTFSTDEKNAMQRFFDTLPYTGESIKSNLARLTPAEAEAFKSQFRKNLYQVTDLLLTGSEVDRWAETFTPKDFRNLIYEEYLQ